LENNNAETLPKKLKGAVCLQLVKCGRRCRCQSGERHPAFYRFFRENGKLRKQYVRRENLALVRAACEARRQARRESREARQQWREMVALIQEVERGE
jgi:hypothetical protein